MEKLARPREESEQVVLITGASAGLGLAISRLLVGQSRFRLILTARASSLSRFATEGIEESERILIRPLDVTDETQRRDIIAEAEARWGGVDILVNNAGIAYRSVVEHVNEAERIEQIHVNFRAPIALAALVLPGMRRRRAGRILNISSVGGMMAMPTMAIYSASKFALEGASESLWYEVRPWGIHVTLVEPGFIHSDGFERTLYTQQSRRSFEDPHDPYHAHYQSMAGFIARIMSMTWSSPERVARTVLAQMRASSPPLRVYATLDAHLFALMRRLLPRFLYHAVLYHFLPRIRTWGPAWEARMLQEAERGEEPTLEVAGVAGAQLVPEAIGDVGSRVTTGASASAGEGVGK